MFMGEFFTQMSCTLHEQWSLSSLRMIPSFSGGPHFGQKWHLVVDESSCLSLQNTLSKPSMVLVTATLALLENKQSKKMCFNAHGRPSFLVCIPFRGLHYFQLARPCIQSPSDRVQHSSVLLALKSSVTFFSKNATPQKSPLIPINP